MAESGQYTDQDIQAIIGRALEREAGGKGTVSHADLLAIGEQVGISPTAMEHAAREVLEARLDTEAHRRVSASRKRWLWAHVALFAAINALLFTVNALTTPGEWWVIFSVVFWGLALGLHAAVALGAGISAGRQRRERARLAAEPGAQTRPLLRVAEPATLPQASVAGAPDSDALAPAPQASRADK